MTEPTVLDDDPATAFWIAAYASRLERDKPGLAPIADLLVVMEPRSAEALICALISEGIDP